MGKALNNLFEWPWSEQGADLLHYKLLCDRMAQAVVPLGLCVAR